MQSKHFEGDDSARDRECKRDRPCHNGVTPRSPS